ncbi:hypothetical protein L2755_18885 [Shewanella abyssi]|uniref:hypothetical protein n=1 Tax=Shewanella abyssi TaxID=311789 RepID=UPI00200EC4C6|nr:hypothetical protein [Shewanella abyssi]MCL1051679.1 hypothetical protein [Shewanella abyssi]
MENGLEGHLEKLRNVLLSLPHSGSSGFEGLIGLALSSITKIPFRLAGSGSQFGLDGKASFQNDPICFECKRYDKTPTRESILAKITDLSIHEHEVDIWVLVSTAPIKTQIIDDVRKAGDKYGLFVFVLDWSDTSLPLLAAALAKVGKSVEDFILKNATSPSHLLSEVATTLDAIRQSSQLEPQFDRIMSELDVAHLSYSTAQKENESWLLNKFSDRTEAKVHLGQPICPNALSAKHIKQRHELVKKLEPYYMNDNPKKLVIISGKEGCGKSWILAQSWLVLKHKPILLFFRPEDLPNDAADFDFSELLVRKLIKQTSSRITPEKIKRWHRLIEQWRFRPDDQSRNLVIVIDGINQKPNSDWGNLLDTIYLEVKSLGASIVISTRKQYFDYYIKNRIESSYDEINIPEWSISERDEILLKNEIIGSDLKNKVAKSLCNPRLLGISLELLSQEEIENIGELNVSRLLFEHMRRMEREANKPVPFSSFAKRLVNDATAILDRVEIGQEDDLRVFQGELAIVADGRFYELLDDEPSSYYLKEEGVTLALSLSIIEQLKKALRNNRNTDDVLNKIIDPIAALDDTSNVIISAITIAALDIKCDEKILTSLLLGFTHMQNTNAGDFPVFVCAAKKSPLAFAIAARFICLEGGHQANFDWLQGALLNICSVNSLWKAVEKEVISWLALYSLSPKLSTYKNSEEELQKQSQYIASSIEALSEYEREILSNLERRDDCDLNQVSTLALSLLAGKPLTIYVKELFLWKFSQQLNSSHSSSSKDFYSLIRFNNIDWFEMQKSFQFYCEHLRGNDVSRVGKWTLVSILRAIGDTERGLEDEQLVCELIKDEERFGSWRLIENYCSVDPCDPHSQKPENISVTAKKYELTDANKIHISFGVTSDDSYIESASYGLSRFEPAIAVSKYREIIDSVLVREGSELRQGIFGITRHSALITKAQTLAIVSKWKSLEKCDDTSHDEWLIRQYLMLLVFPHLSEQEQLNIFLSDYMEESVLLELLTLLKPVKSMHLEKYISKILRTEDEHLIYQFLLFIRYTDNRVTDCIRDIINLGWGMDSKKIKTEILAIAVETQDKPILKLVVDSGMNSNERPDDTDRSQWYLSMALLAALRKGLLPSIEAIERISPSVYGRAISLLDTESTISIIALVDKSLELSIGFESPPVNIEIELEISPTTSNQPNRFRINGTKPSSEEMEGKLKSFFNDESIEEFTKRQELAHNSFENFRLNLSRQNASLVLDDMAADQLQKLINENEEITEKWFKLFVNLGESQLPIVYNFVLKFCFAIHQTEPSKSLKLLDKVANCKPWVNQVFGKAKIPIKSFIYWGLEGEIFKKYQFRFLDEANTDKELLLEVLAALMNNKQELLREYVASKTSRIEPSEVARGLMVVGFSDQSLFNDNLLEEFKEDKGLLGQAYQAASYAYNRNVWSKHWYKLMNSSKNLEDYWSYNQLFLKVVDQRFETWKSELFEDNSLNSQFEHSFKNKLTKRYNRWNTHRDKKLFGLDAPKPIFIQKI